METKAIPKDACYTNFGGGIQTPSHVFDFYGKVKRNPDHEAMEALAKDAKPCPFCGKKPVPRVGQESMGGDCCDIFILECIACQQHPYVAVPGPWGYRRDEDLTREQAIEKCRTLWNMRAE